MKAPDGFSQPAVLLARPTGERGGLVTQSEQPAAVLRSADDGRRAHGRRCLAQWAANAPLVFLDQYVGNLREYRAIALDVGDQDNLRTDTGKLHEALEKYSIHNSFEVYPGTHTSAVADRFQNHVMPFFSAHLCDSSACRGKTH